MVRGRLTTTTAAAAMVVSAALWTSFGLLAVTSAASSRRIGILPSPWVLAAVMAATLALFAYLRLSSRASLPLFLSLLIVLPWLPVPLPDVVLAWTGPAVSLVWAAIGLTLMASIAAERGLRPAWLLRAEAAPYAAAVLAFAVFLSVRSGQRLPPTGDEPHYLVIAQSLLADHDVVVGNNYDRGDYRRYYAGFLEPHASVTADGLAYSVHSPGVSALVAPAFALGGYWASVLWLAALCAAGTALVWRAGYVLTGQSGAAWFGWAVVVSTAPGALHGSLIYPDSIAGCILAGGVLALVLAHSGRTWPLAGSLALGAGAGALPWLHTRLALPAASLAAVIALRMVTDGVFHGRRRRHLVAFFAPAGIAVAGWFGFFWTIHHTFSPVSAYGNVVPLELRRIGPGLLALLADQESGLLPSAPIHLVSLGSFWWVRKRSPRLGCELLLLAGPYVIALAAYDLWWGGFTPPARFLVPVVFVAGAGVASVWAQTQARGRAVAATLFGVSVLIAAALAFGGDGSLAYNTSTGRARVLDWASPLVDLPRAFPSFFRGTSAVAIEWAFAWPIVLWALVLSAGWILFASIDKRLPAGQAPRLVTAAATLALVFSCGVATSWSIRGDVRLMAARAQLQLLRGENRRLRPFGVQPFPAAAFPSEAALTRLAISTPSTEPASPHTLLFLPELPPGPYRIQLKRRADARGQLALGIGLATMPFARWPLADDPNDRFRFTLPLHASSLVVRGDDEAMRSVEDVVLIPTRRSFGATALAGRARDAGRFGSHVVYALDDRVWLEAGGFWVMGERQPDVVIVSDDPAPTLAIEALNGPIANRLRVRSGGWSVDRALAPDERWPIHIPMAGSGRPVVVNFEVERGFRPIDVDPQSRDRRMLGCWIAIR